MGPEPSGEMGVSPLTVIHNNPIKGFGFMSLGVWARLVCWLILCPLGLTVISSFYSNTNLEVTVFKDVINI